MKHLGDILEAFGETYLARVAKKGKTRRDQYFNIKIIFFRRDSPKELILPRVLMVAVTKYLFLQ